MTDGWRDQLGRRLARVATNAAVRTPRLWAAFRPFVPTGGRCQERDSAEELERKAKLERELPVEGTLPVWSGGSGAPAP